MDLNLSISTNIYDKRDDFDFDTVNSPLLDGDDPRRTWYGVYISQLNRFARTSSNFSDFNCRNKDLTVNLLWQGYRYHKLRTAFSKFYRRGLVENYNVRLKKLYRNQDSVVTSFTDLEKIVAKSIFSEQFRKPFSRFKRI